MPANPALAILNADIIHAAQGHGVLADADHADFLSALCAGSSVRNGHLWAGELSDEQVEAVLSSWDRGGRGGRSAHARRQPDVGANVRGCIAHSAMSTQIDHTSARVLGPAAMAAVAKVRQMEESDARALLMSTVEQYGRRLTLAEALLDGDLATTLLVTDRLLDIDWHDSDHGQGSTRFVGVAANRQGPTPSELILAA